MPDASIAVLLLRNDSRTWRHQSRPWFSRILSTTPRSIVELRGAHLLDPLGDRFREVQRPRAGGGGRRGLAAGRSGGAARGGRREHVEPGRAALPPESQTRSHPTKVDRFAGDFVRHGVGAPDVNPACLHAVVLSVRNTREWRERSEGPLRVGLTPRSPGSSPRRTAERSSDRGHRRLRSYPPVGHFVIVRSSAFAFNGPGLSESNGLRSMNRLRRSGRVKGGFEAAPGMGKRRAPEGGAVASCLSSAARLESRRAG